MSPFFGKPEGFLSCIHADDAASAVVSALQAPTGVYNVVEDSPLRRRELIDAIAAAEGQPPPLLVPPPLAALGGNLVRALMRSQRVSNWKLKSTTGWHPRYRCAVQGWRVTELASSPPAEAEPASAPPRSGRRDRETLPRSQARQAASRNP